MTSTVGAGSVNVEIVLLAVLTVEVVMVIDSVKYCLVLG